MRVVLQIAAGAIAATLALPWIMGGLMTYSEWVRCKTVGGYSCPVGPDIPRTPFPG